MTSSIPFQFPVPDGYEAVQENGRVLKHGLVKIPGVPNDEHCLISYEEFDGYKGVTLYRLNGTTYLPSQNLYLRPKDRYCLVTDAINPFLTLQEAQAEQAKWDDKNTFGHKFSIAKIIP